MKLTDEDLKAIREELDRLAPRDWGWDKDLCLFTIDEDGDMEVLNIESGSHGDTEIRAFIAHAPRIIRRLLDHIDAVAAWRGPDPR